PGEAHVAAQLRGRMFFPTTVQGATPFHSSNEPLGSWFGSGAVRTHVLPGPFQLFQFSCIYAADPKDADRKREHDVTVWKRSRGGRGGLQEARKWREYPSSAPRPTTSQGQSGSSSEFPQLR
ncbi:MAG: hypothetical protein ACE5F1_21700, partial [Planctomycetota bacterium]